MPKSSKTTGSSKKEPGKGRGPGKNRGCEPKVGGARGVVHTAMAGTKTAMQFVGLEGGRFCMGSPNNEADRDDDEGPVHAVSVSAFDIAKTEVTQGQWKAVMDGKNPSHCFAGGCDEALPVQQISWYDAIEFLNRLSTSEGKTPCYEVKGERVTLYEACNGYRLPTEAE